MAASKLTLMPFLLLLALILSPGIRADIAVDDGGVEAVGRGFDASALRAQLDLLKSKIHSLESVLEEKSRELKVKDEQIAEKQKLLQDESDKVTSLQGEISMLQKKGKMVAAEQVVKAHARVGELEKQIVKLKKELESQQKEKGSLQSHASEFDNKMLELNSKLEELQRVNDLQKAKILKAEQALKVAEKELIKAKFQASSKTKELLQVHGAWLPPWLALHWARLKSFAEVHWNEHGKPAMNLMMEKTLEKKSQAEKWAEPHIEIIKSKWVPAVKEQWVIFATSLQPHLTMLRAKSIEAYETSKTAITPHIVKIQQSVDPYYQEAKKFSKPYIDQVATVAKPHVEKVKVSMEPYKKEAIHAYWKFLQSASTYHKQIQGHVQETLKKHEITRPLATREFEWFAASVLLVLPIISLSRICSAVFCQNAKKPARHAHPHHARRKAKRVHADKK